MFIIYDLVFLLFSLSYFPIYLFKRKFHAGFMLRLGCLPKNLKLDKPIWVHAVSVGEAMSIRPLVEQLRSAFPGKKFVISTVTPTGNKIAQAIAQKGDFVTYLPLDFSFIVRSVINKIDPSVFIIAETEIWPNLISCLHKKNIPVVTVNGRISDSSFRGYSAVKFLIKNILKKVSLFCVQSDRDAARFKALGVVEGKIRVTGNMKFDIKDYAGFQKDHADLKNKLGLKTEDKVFIAASTHPREEEIILSVYRKLREDFPNLNLIIVPRHPERCKDVASAVSKYMFCHKFISADSSQSITCATKTVFILDVIGRLLDFYSIADIVFVGGSLVKKGGHNILEPASLSRPVIFGPQMFNFRDIVELFLANKAAIQVDDPDDLFARISFLLNNPSQAMELGKKAEAIIRQNQGATARNIEFIRKVVV